MIKIGMFQMSVSEGKPEQNKMHIEDVISQHCNDDLDLICLPELCVSGYDYEVAINSEEEREFFSKIAKKYSIALIAGFFLKEGNEKYDAVGFWNEKGELLGQYKKIHTYASEKGFFSKGNELCIVTYNDWRIGILVCADLGFPEISRILVDKGCDLVIYPSAWVDGEGFASLFTNCGRIRAAENQIFTIVLNRADGNQKYCGYTTVSNPNGTPRVFVDDSNEHFISVALEKETISECRQIISWQMDRRDALYRFLVD